MTESVAKRGRLGNVWKKIADCGEGSRNANEGWTNI